MMLLYFETEKRRYLFISSVFLCLQIISYPSCIIVFVAVLVLLCLFSKRKWSDISIFAISCFIQGSLYIGYFVQTVGISALAENLILIIKGDSYHSESIWAKFSDYCNDFLCVFAVMMVILFGSYLVCRITCLIVAKKFLLVYSMYLFWGVLFLGSFIYTLLVRDRYAPLVIYFPILLLGLGGIKVLNSEQKRLYFSGILINGFSFVAALILTNLTLIDTLNYLILSIIVSLISIKKSLEQNTDEIKRGLIYGIIIAFLLLSLFRSTYFIRPMYYHLCSILRIEGVVKDGPAIGIMSEYIGPYVINTAMEEWEQYIQEGDSLLLVGSAFGTHTIGYLYEDVEIATSSTISTPTFDENIVLYWEKNPDKMPDVVAVECWYGELSIEEDSFIYQWIVNEFKPSLYEDGKYWRYYVKGNG